MYILVFIRQQSFVYVLCITYCIHLNIGSNGHGIYIRSATDPKIQVFISRKLKLRRAR
jgi:hypothetical protein